MLKTYTRQYIVNIVTNDYQIFEIKNCKILE